MKASVRSSVEGVRLTIRESDSRVAVAVETGGRAGAGGDVE
jgi:hypothetical protein